MKTLGKLCKSELWRIPHFPPKLLYCVCFTTCISAFLEKYFSISVKCFFLKVWHILKCENVSEVLESEVHSFLDQVSYLMSTPTLWLKIFSYLKPETFILRQSGDYSSPPPPPPQMGPKLKNTFNGTILRHKPLQFRGSVKVFSEYLFRTIAHNHILHSQLI